MSVRVTRPRQDTEGRAVAFRPESAVFVRQSFASRHADERMSVDPAGCRWTEGCGLRNRRMPEAVRLLAAHRFIERRGRDLNPRHALTTRNGFRDLHKHVCVQSPVFRRAWG